MDILSNRSNWPVIAAFLAPLSLLLVGLSLFSVLLAFSALLGGIQFARWSILNANGEILLPLIDIWLNSTQSETKKTGNNADSTTSNKRKPWEGLTLPSGANEQMEFLLDQIIDKYISNWYSADIGCDEAFLNEIRHQLRFASSKLYLRLSELDLSQILGEEAVPIASIHIHKICQALNSLKLQDAPIAVSETQICKQFSDLHYCMGSRTNEVNYLRQVADLLIANLLDDSSLSGRSHDDDDGPKSNSQTRIWPSHAARHFIRELVVNCIFIPLLDSIGDPDTINSIILLTFDYLESKEVSLKENEKVEFLKSLTDTVMEKVPDSLLQLKLSEILRDDRQFAMFRQYLKDIRGPMNHLKFLSEASRIHDSMQRKNESSSQITYDSWQLFGQFVHSSSPDRIDFDPEIVEQFTKAIEGSNLDELYKVIEKCYQDVYKYMQSEFVVHYCQSDSYLGYLCGSPPFSVVELIDRNQPERRSSSFNRLTPFSSFRSQFRRLFTLSAESSVEGKDALADDFYSAGVDTGNVLPRAVSQNSINDSEVRSEDGRILNIPSVELEEEECVASLEDDEVSNAESTPAEQLDRSQVLVIDSLRRNINQWKIAISKIVPIRDSVTGRTIYVYLIDVERSDAEEHETKMWSIYRRFPEFYALEAKLVEFHRDSLRFSTLPQRKTFATRNRAFMEQHRLCFASFLSSLCKQKLLNRSDLLFAFLTSPDEFRDTLALSDLNPWKVVKNMPGKLSREKGQHLQPFLLNLLATTLAPQDTQHVYNEKVETGSETSSISSLSVMADGSSSLYSPIYGNNCHGMTVDEEPKGEGTQLWLRCSSDAVILLVHTLFDPLSSWMINIISSVRLLSKRTIDRLFSYLFGQIEGKLVQEATLLSIVQLIQNSLLCQEDIIPTEQEKSLRQELAKRKLLEFVQDRVPSSFVERTCRDKLRVAATKMLHCLQFPRLNKQLSYLLLDILLKHLFIKNEE